MPNYKQQRPPIQYKRMRVQILDKHDSKTEQSSNKHNIVLAMHSFTEVLASLSHKKNLKLLIEGQAKAVIHNIIWNEYFSHTLLKDINSVVFAEAQFKKVFMKIGSKTYRLTQIMEWGEMIKIQHEIISCPTLHLEGFMQDSSMKFVTIQIGYFNHTQFDIVFEYNCVNKKQASSFNSTCNTQNKSYSTHKLREISMNKSMIPINSLFQSRQQKINRPDRNDKYQTQKKKENRIMKSHNQKQKHTVEIDSARKTEKQMNSKQNKQQLIVDVETVQNNSKHRQDLVAMLLYKKDEQLKQYRVILQQKQNDFSNKIAHIEKTHEEEVSTIKKQVQNILSDYKKKNKALRKQNECLTEMNHKLSIANLKLQETIGKLCEEMNNLKDGQSKLQKSNMQNSSKLQTIEAHNSALMERMSLQQASFKEEITKKERSMSDMKQKYDRLLGNIRSATADVDKENIY